MASEILAINEEQLGAAIDVIRAGIDVLGSKVPPRLRKSLETWCAEEAEYMVEAMHREFWPTLEREGKPRNGGK